MKDRCNIILNTKMATITTKGDISIFVMLIFIKFDFTDLIVLYPEINNKIINESGIIVQKIIKVVKSGA